ncbi:MAG: hypothetical protein AB7S86_07700 [Hydrogenophaga sp.]|uniref:hypothetical protein n=1 Tax=Hydrogenophaga sp. TaxID=1904254 RepID=UPI003D149C5A
MTLTTLSGTVTGIRHSTETMGQIGKNGGSVQTGQVMAFRVDERSAQIKLKDMPDLRDGERVTLAGRAKNGTFRALALRNDQTRAVYATAAWPGYVMGGIMVALGIPLSLMVIGLPFLVVGLYTLYQAYSYAKAEKMLQG